MFRIRLTKKERIKHLLIWIIISVAITIVDPPPKTSSIAKSLIAIFLLILSYTSTYYFLALYILPRYWRSNKVRIYLTISLLFVWFWSCYWGIITQVFPSLFKIDLNKNIPFIGLLLDSLLLFFFISGFSFSFFINKKRKFEIDMQTEQERILLIKEFVFLKNQLNSHTTFNFLNYCYSLIEGSSKKGAKSIELFSDMLRYTSSIKSEHLIELTKEISYIENFIALKKLLSARVYVNFEYNISNRHLVIAPRILITFIENAFKHGRFDLLEDPILINLDEYKNSLRLKVQNKIRKSPEKYNTGSGINNVKDLLDFFYHDQYTLKISNQENVFMVLLDIRLK